MMTDDDLQAEIDLEADRIRVWRETRRYRADLRVAVIREDLAAHMVNNRAVKLQNDTRVLVEAAREAHDARASDPTSMSGEQLTAHWQRLSRIPKKLEAALAPFKESHGFPDCNCRIVAVDPAEEGKASYSVDQWLCTACGAPVAGPWATCPCGHWKPAQVGFAKRILRKFRLAK